MRLRLSEGRTLWWNCHHRRCLDSCMSPVIRSASVLTLTTASWCRRSRSQLLRHPYVCGVRIQRQVFPSLEGEGHLAKSRVQCQPIWHLYLRCRLRSLNSRHPRVRPRSTGGSEVSYSAFSFRTSIAIFIALRQPTCHRPWLCSLPVTIGCPLTFLPHPNTPKPVALATSPSQPAIYQERDPKRSPTPDTITLYNMMVPAAAQYCRSTLSNGGPLKAASEGPQRSSTKGGRGDGMEGLRPWTIRSWPHAQNFFSVRPLLIVHYNIRLL